LCRPLPFVFFAKFVFAKSDKKTALLLSTFYIPAKVPKCKKPLKEEEKRIYVTDMAGD
jgi:hypothetical protein